MKLDLTRLIKGQGQRPNSEEEFRRHLRESLVEIIRLELEGLPKEEWDRTLKTWVKICSFADSLRKKDEKERQDLYRRYNFDSLMVHITESVIEKLNMAYFMGLMQAGSRPEKIILLGLVGDEDSEEIRFIKSFFRA